MEHPTYMYVGSDDGDLDDLVAPAVHGSLQLGFWKFQTGQTLPR